MLTPEHHWGGGGFANPTPSKPLHRLHLRGGGYADPWTPRRINGLGPLSATALGRACRGMRSMRRGQNVGRSRLVPALALQGIGPWAEHLHRGHVVDWGIAMH